MRSVDQLEAALQGSDRILKLLEANPTPNPILREALN